MSHFRAVLTFAVVGTLLGIVAATLGAPSILASQLCGFGSTIQLNSACNQTVETATAGLIRYQLYGGLGGTVLGMIAGIVFTVRRGKKAPDAVSAPVVPKA